MSAAPLSDLERTMLEARNRLAAAERDAARRMLADYRGIQQRLDERLAALLDRIEQRQAAGQPITRATLQREQRYRDLLTQVYAEMTRYSTVVGEIVDSQVTAAAQAGTTDAAQLVSASLGETPAGITVGTNRLPTEAIQEAAGALGEGSPVRGIIDNFGPDASAAVRQALLAGTTQGLGPRELARDIRKALNVTPVRALLIARTEQLRAYRASSLQTYRANRRIVSSWTWISAADRRSCAVCWAQHGTVHDLDEILVSHPGCRCSMVPRTVSWKELGLAGVPDTRQVIETGESRFARLRPEDQLSVLGPVKMRMYNSGMPLSDLVGKTHSPKWGPGLREKSIRELTS